MKAFVGCTAISLLALITAVQVAHAGCSQGGIGQPPLGHRIPPLAGYPVPTGPGVDDCLSVPGIQENDSNNDGFGNACDADYNQDCIVNIADYLIFAFDFRIGFETRDTDHDEPPDGYTSAQDFFVFADRFALGSTSPD